MPNRGKAEYAEISPYRLLREAPALAQNRIPKSLSAYCRVSGMRAWELLEEAVFFFFRQVLMLETRRMGDQCLFVQEPEGVVIVGRDPQPFALLYECKSRKSAYKMSADDTLRYREYFKTQRHRLRHRHHVELTHFVIVAPEFSGNLNARIDHLQDHGFTVSLVSASLLQKAARLIAEMEVPDIHLLDLRRLFSRGLGGDDSLHACFCTESCICGRPQRARKLKVSPGAQVATSRIVPRCPRAKRASSKKAEDS
jgi:hypothetical protein